jgi:hypothetical protein
MNCIWSCETSWVTAGKNRVCPKCYCIVLPCSSNHSSNGYALKMANVPEKTEGDKSSVLKE